MFKITLLSLLSGALIFAASIVWVTGKVQDAKTGETASDSQWLIVGETDSYWVGVPSAHDPKNINAPHSDTNPVVKALRDRKPRRQSCRLIVGDSIKYSQHKGILYVVDADNRKCALEILRQERLK
ncbi:MAG: hypothetical protein M3Y72_18815 [Acidobacteriota bacterium]|nr:hypothetical protein [Acidobacteriota bacterium]